MACILGKPSRLVALGHLSANGTLATATVEPVVLGLHTDGVRYPGDVYYRPFTFGTVAIFIQWDLWDEAAWQGS